MQIKALDTFFDDTRNVSYLNKDREFAVLYFRHTHNRLGIIYNTIMKLFAVFV